MSEYLTATEFAKKMNVHVCTVGRWCKDGLIEGAYEEGHPTTHWRIPVEAVARGRPLKLGRRPRSVLVKTKAESEVVMKLRNELADLNKRFVDMFEQKVGLQGRYDRLVEVHERTKHELKHKEIEVEALKEDISVAESKLLLLSERVSQLEGGKTVPSLSIRGQ